MNPRRCVLFVPGSRPERYPKAFATDADQVCIDLEDAVGPADKDSARATVVAFLAAHQPVRSECGVRINAVGTTDGEHDLAALAQSPAAPDFVMLPKVESAEAVRHVDRTLGHQDTRIIALIETPRGLLDARAIAAASPKLSALMFGGFDFMVALRGRPGWDSFLPPRAQLAWIASEAGLGFIDVPWLDFRDPAGLAAETDRVIALGATAKAAIHPDQVAVIQTRFLPSAAELAHARQVVAAIEAAHGAAVQVDGKLVDRPIELAARRAIALGALGTRS